MNTNVKVPKGRQDYRKTPQNENLAPKGRHTPKTP